LTFRFQVGDAIFFYKPAGGGFSQAEMVAKYTNSPVVHAGIVSYVPPEQVDGVQIPDDIIVTEALKGEFKKVTQQTLRHVIQRWAFGGYSIRRVDPKYIHLKDHYADITSFLNTQKDKPFDSDMVNPTKRHWGTAGRYIDPAIPCQERDRALALYRAGGLGTWFCSDLIIWTLAFPGGINMDYDNPYDQCPGAGWPLTNMQEYPGALMNEQNIWNQAILWHLPCNEAGCWVGAPMSWQGGLPPAATAPTPAPASSSYETAASSGVTAAAAGAASETVPVSNTVAPTVTVPVSALSDQTPTLQAQSTDSSR
jgi:hypothetical protein